MLARIVIATIFALCVLSGTSFAADSTAKDDIALARNSMLLYGGPSKEYPRIGIVTWGQGLSVLGCQQDTLWCEVQSDGQRGWVPAKTMTWSADGPRKVMRKRINPLRLTL
jgi:uncharacterized protein YraI